jgi:hypothetical protein
MGVSKLVVLEEEAMTLMPEWGLEAVCMPK